MDGIALDHSTWEEVRRCQVAQQVVDGEVEAAVDEDGQHDQDVGEDDDKAHQHAQADDDIVPLTPVVADILAALLVEEFHRAVVVAAADVLLSPIHQHYVLEGGRLSWEKWD